VVKSRGQTAASEPVAERAQAGAGDGEGGCIPVSHKGEDERETWRVTSRFLKFIRNPLVYQYLSAHLLLWSYRFLPIPDYFGFAPQRAAVLLNLSKFLEPQFAKLGFWCAGFMGSTRWSVVFCIPFLASKMIR
jgi:hypothetical protein